MPQSNPRVIVVPGSEDVAAAACGLVVEAGREAIARSGQFHVALAGGNTPRRLYELLAESPDADFANWHVFFGDERWVTADHPDNNARMAREALLDRVSIPPQQVHAIDTSSGAPERAAQLYALTLRRRLPSEAGALPRLDLALLGLGNDGHTASLFPGSSALTAGPGALVVSTWAPTPRAWRVTMTAALFNASRAVVFLVSGPDKAEALERVLRGGSDAPPAATIRPAHGALTFVVDEAAAVRIGDDARVERTVDLFSISPALPALPASPGH